MGRKVYLIEEGKPKDYLFHNHGIAEICHQKNIGDINLHHACVTKKDLIENFDLSKEDFAELLFDGKLVFDKKENDKEIYVEARPVSCDIIFTKEDIETIKSFVESKELEKEGIQCENFEKMLEIHEMRNLDKYRLFVELNPVTF